MVYLPVSTAQEGYWRGFQWALSLWNVRRQCTTSVSNLSQYSMQCCTSSVSSIIRQLNFLFSGHLRYHNLRHSSMEHCVSKWWTINGSSAKVSLAKSSWSPLFLFSVFFVILLYILFGAADIANNTTRWYFKGFEQMKSMKNWIQMITRIVITSLLIPEKKQQTFGASKFYHVRESLSLRITPRLDYFTIQW